VCCSRRLRRPIRAVGRLRRWRPGGRTSSAGPTGRSARLGRLSVEARMAEVHELPVPARQPLPSAPDEPSPSFPQPRLLQRPVFTCQPGAPGHYCLHGRRKDNHFLPGRTLV
jgi:hypothetical protein